mgnify:CR=1 FL=1
MQKNISNKLTAVTIGDIKGVGIQILIKVWKRKKLRDFVLFTNYELFNKYILKNKISIKIFRSSIINNKITFQKNSFNIFDITAKNYNQNTYNSLIESYKLVKKKLFIGLVTLPINKKKINTLNSKFIDQTTLFTKKDGKKISNMIFVHKNIFFVPLTIHIELKKVTREYKKADKYIKKIKNLNDTIIRDFGIKKPKFIMAGINPHNGENGIISNEDHILLNPIFYKLKKMKIDIHGPISPDAIVNKKNLDHFDCFIFTYHDQALIPFKLISRYSGVNYTSNLDVIRVSPDHGTAYDIVGKNNESPLGVINSFKLLKKISLNRTKYETTKKIPRSKFPN